ncbi:hypothetical protein [Streptomyces chartreusis]|uniref:hypothetical protein n=1 Tax=Streptomyces chartreusis TaxID=1969 RepID=UPI002F919414|nr:hypothetical protein OG938_44540 [Streptomyces chartreusis]
MADPLDPLFKALESINEELSGLHIRLARVEDQQSISGAGGPGGAEGEGRVPGTPIVWRKLEDPERSDLWVEFTGWVFDIADQFELTVDQLPRDCWWLHGGVVEELTALWTSHRSAFEIKDDSGASVYLWHDAFARALDRISRSWLGECTNGYHQPRSRERWGTDAKLRATIIGAGPPPSRRSPGPENPDLLAS